MYVDDNSPGEGLSCYHLISELLLIISREIKEISEHLTGLKLYFRLYTKTVVRYLSRESRPKSKIFNILRVLIFKIKFEYSLTVEKEIILNAIRFIYMKNNNLFEDFRDNYILTLK